MSLGASPLATAPLATGPVSLAPNGSVTSTAAGSSTTATLTGRATAGGTAASAAGSSATSALAGLSTAAGVAAAAGGSSTTSTLVGASSGSSGSAAGTAAGSSTTAALTGRATAAGAAAAAAGASATGATGSSTVAAGTYPPSLPIMRDSTTQRLHGIEPARASNGALKIRRFAPGEKMIFNLVHWLSDAQRATLESTYSTNRVASMSFIWPEDGATYTVRFGDAPQYMKKPGYWVSLVQLLEQ